jgi:hypothetical protein
MILTLTNSLYLGPGWAQYSLLLGAGIVFYIAQWEEYHTGVLELGMINVTEMQFLTMFIHIVSGVLGKFKICFIPSGPRVWAHTLTVAGYSFAVNRAMVVAAVLGSFTVVPDK